MLTWMRDPVQPFFNEVATSNSLGRRDNAGLHKQVVGRNNYKQGVK